MYNFHTKIRQCLYAIICPISFFYENDVEYILWTGEVGSWRKLHKRGFTVRKLYEIYSGLQIKDDS